MYSLDPKLIIESSFMLGFVINFRHAKDESTLTFVNGSFILNPVAMSALLLLFYTVAGMTFKSDKGSSELSGSVSSYLGLNPMPF